MTSRSWRLESVTRSRKRAALGAEGRICAADGCDTLLSRFNRSDRCAVHAESARAPTERGRARRAPDGCDG
jgi:hypothetical protein